MLGLATVVRWGFFLAFLHQMVKYMYFTSMSGLHAMHIHNKIQHKDKQIRHSWKSKVKTNSKRTVKTNRSQRKARPGLMMKAKYTLEASWGRWCGERAFKNGGKSCSGWGHRLLHKRHGTKIRSVIHQILWCKGVGQDCPWRVALYQCVGMRDNCESGKWRRNMVRGGLSWNYFWTTIH